MTKTVFISGANRGFGLALLQVFWDQGWNIIALVRSENAKDDLQLRFKNRVSVIVADLSNDSSIEQIERHLLGIELDILINNAGIKGGKSTLITTETAEIENSININCLGVLRCVKGCFNAIDSSKKAKIINISSRLGSISRVAQGHYDNLKVSYAYRISKAAMNMLTSCLAVELNPKGISVHSLHPGKLLTDVGMPDADMSLEIAAQRTFHAICELPEKSPALFFEPEVGEINW